MQETLGIRNDDVFKAASGFGGGIGRLGDTCGALLGASMMLSLAHGRGRDQIEDPGKMDKSGEMVAGLYRWFQAEFGSATCRDIRTRFGGGTFYDFSVPEEWELALKAGVPEKCCDLVGRAAAKATEMLWDSA